MKFGLFYLAQYVLNFLLCAITVIVFFGGWQFPGISQLAALGYDPVTNPQGNVLFNVLAGVLGVTVFLAKTYGFFFLMVLLRGALPRLRVDQLMDFGWKYLIPLTVVNIISGALWLALTQWGAAQGLGAVEGLSEWARFGIAFVLTAAINIAAIYLIAMLNERLKQDETAAPGQRPEPAAAG
jgi:NADH-quinone oxidoreductase subunit H